MVHPLAWDPKPIPLRDVAVCLRVRFASCVFAAGAEAPFWGPPGGCLFRDKGWRRARENPAAASKAQVIFYSTSPRGDKPKVV